MARIESAGNNPKKKKNGAARRATARTNAVRKSDVTSGEEEPVAPPVGRLERTRRLILAALRVWELKRKIHD